MRVTHALAVSGLALGAIGAGLFSAPSASADCVSSGGTTLCSQGEARGSDKGGGPSGSVYTPYPCEYDWYCDDVNWDVDLDPGPIRPDVGLPGRPGNRPGIGR